MYVTKTPSWRKDCPPQHNIGSWVVTREDALVEAGYLAYWYRQKDEAFQIITELAKTLDQDKEDEYIDSTYNRR